MGIICWNKCLKKSVYRFNIKGIVLSMQGYLKSDYASRFNHSSFTDVLLMHSHLVQVFDLPICVNRKFLASPLYKL